jgi:branched-chain amino acid transport system substrate-binding protein
MKSSTSHPRVRRSSLSAATALVVLATLASSCSGRKPPIRVGAVYPLSGSQGPGGLEEYQGVATAVVLVNQDGGVDGRPVDLRAIDVAGADAAPDAVATLHREGISFVLGSYGSTIALPASQAAARNGMLYWETGAVGQMTEEGAGRLIFRVSPSGGVLGQAAVRFVARQLAPLLNRSAGTLRFAVTNVDDVYGRAVAQGAV